MPHGIPCADTFGRVFARLDPEQMQDCFLSWVQAIRQLLGAEVVGIDGKTLRHSGEPGRGKAAIHMVSAWASANRLVLGQRKVDDKSNEITAIPALLSVLEIAGCIVTIDAMGCQRAIATVISERGADYVLALKGNQDSLFEDVQWLFQQAQATGFKDVAHSFAQSIDKGHGRLEIRRCWTMADLNYLIQAPLWTGLQTIVMVQSERHCKGQVTQENRFFISSLPSQAPVLLHAVRMHWSIENSLHWVLDVSFFEDDCRIRRDAAPQNLALLRHLALNLLAQDSSTKRGIAARRKKAAWDQNYLIKLLTQ